MGLAWNSDCKLLIQRTSTIVLRKNQFWLLLRGQHKGRSLRLLGCCLRRKTKFGGNRCPWALLDPGLQGQFVLCLWFLDVSGCFWSQTSESCCCSTSKRHTSAQMSIDTNLQSQVRQAKITPGSPHKCQHKQVSKTVLELLGQQSQQSSRQWANNQFVSIRFLL